MARVTNPFLSMDASGTVGKSLTACKWKGRNYMRKHFIPMNPNTTAQVNVRTAVSLASAEFKDMIEANQEIWNNYAAAYNNSGIAIFMQQAMNAYMDQLGSSTTPVSLTITDPDTPSAPGLTWSDV